VEHKLLYPQTIYQSMATNLHPNSAHMADNNNTNIAKWCHSFYAVTEYEVRNVPDIRRPVSVRVVSKQLNTSSRKQSRMHDSPVLQFSVAKDMGEFPIKSTQTGVPSMSVVGTFANFDQ